MNRVSEHINTLNLFDLIIPFFQILQISGQCGRITADIDHPLWLHLCDTCQQALVTALSRRIHHDDVCMDMLTFISLRQYFFCLSHINFSIMYIIDCSIALGIINGLRNNFNPIDLFGLLGDKK